MTFEDVTKVFTAIKPNIAALEYPFSFISESQNPDGTNYCVADFFRGIPGEEVCYPDNFPHNIEEYYYIDEGENDEKPWACLCKLTNGLYVYYTASCDYTGFDCQGGMVLIVSRSPERLFYEGMSEKERWSCLYAKKHM